MQTPDVYEFLVETLIESCKVDPADINPAAHLFSDLGIDSADVLNVAWLVEERYGVQLPVVDWMGDVNVGESVAMDHFRLDNFVAAIARLREASAKPPTVAESLS